MSHGFAFIAYVNGKHHPRGFLRPDDPPDPAAPHRCAAACRPQLGIHAGTTEAVKSPSTR